MDKRIDDISSMISKDIISDNLNGIDHTSVVPISGTTEDICRVDVYDVS